MANSESQIFRVLPKQVDQTIATALREWLRGKSWTEVRGLLKARRVMLSGNLCVDPARRLKLQDVVKILPHPAAPLPKEIDVRIVFLDPHVVVVEKPAGMTSLRHSEERNWPARRKQVQPTLDEVLPRIIAKKDRSGRKSKGARTTSKLRAVHRLDRETSGLMVFARTAEAERHLVAQFRRHTTHRRYLAIACGTVEAQTIESRLVRDRGDGRRGSTTLPGVGKWAITHVRPLEKLGPYTLIECRLETGRTHQIRIHLAEGGHTLCGEKVYIKPQGGKPLEDRSGAPRLALHAAELGFQHPVTGQAMRFETPLPPDLEAFLKRLREEDGRGQRAEGRKQ